MYTGKLWFNRNLYWVKITSGIDLILLLSFIYVLVCAPFSIFQNVPGCFAMNVPGWLFYRRSKLHYFHYYNLIHYNDDGDKVCRIILWVNVFLWFLQMLTRRLFINSKSYKNTNEVLKIIHGILDHVCSPGYLNLSVTFTSAVLFFLIHTCTPCRSVSAAAR